MVQPAYGLPPDDEDAIRRETQRIKARQQLEQLAQKIGGPGTRVADPDKFTRFLAQADAQHKAQGGQGLAPPSGTNPQPAPYDYFAAWDWDAGQFDVVAGIFVQFATPPERARMFAGMCRALRPGGMLLLQGYRPEQIAYGTGGPSKPDQLYTAAMLKQAFAALDIIELREHDSEVHEGKGHDGLSALIDLVARRPAQR